MWNYCNCPDFKKKFLKSTDMYICTAIVVGVLACLQIVPSLLFICRRPRSAPIIPAK